MMKKLSVFAVILVMLSALIFPAFAAKGTEYDYVDPDYYNVPELKGTSINVYNWGEYISEEYDDESYMINVNKEFEKLTGIKVNYTNFDTNEDLYAKLKSGGSSYDVIIPSDYMIARFIAEGLVQKIDFDRIPNYKNIDSQYKSLYYDENNEYSMAYCVSTVGLIYNTKMVDGDPTSWSVLWDSKYAGKILMFDNSRDGFMVAQKLLGQSLNTTDKTEWREAADQLIAQKPLLQAYVMDESYNKMEGGEAALCPYYAGDFICMQEVNPDLDFVYPDEGYNIFVDAACIPTCAKNVRAAELYLNFLADPTVALANAYATGYATPNKTAREMEEYAELADNPYLYPENLSDKAEYYFDLDDDTRGYMNELWNEVKSSGNSSKSLYICYAVTGTIIIAALIYRFAVKKYRESFYDK